MTLEQIDLARFKQGQKSAALQDPGVPFWMNYERHWNVQEPTRVFARLTRGHVETALDIGAGWGYRTRLLAKYCGTMIALDLADEVLTRSRDIPNIKSVGSDADVNLPFRSNLFDAVVSFDVFEHLLNADRFLREAYRIAKTGGFIFIMTPNRIRLTQRVIRFFTRQPWNAYPQNPHHVHEYTIAEVAMATRRAGFGQFGFVPIGLGQQMPIRGMLFDVGVRRPPSRLLDNLCAHILFWGIK